MGASPERAAGGRPTAELGLFGLFWHHRHLLLLSLAAGLLVATAVVAVQPVRYEAVAGVVLAAPVRDPETGAPGADPDRVVRNRVALMGSRAVLTGAARRYAPTDPGADVSGQVRVVASREPDTIEVRARDATPEGAVRLADAMLASYDEVVGAQVLRLTTAARARLAGEEDGLRRRVEALDERLATRPDDLPAQAERRALDTRLSELVGGQLNVVVGTGPEALRQAALAPSRPATPDPPRTLLIGCIAGLAAGMLIAWRVGAREDRRTGRAGDPAGVAPGVAPGAAAGEAGGTGESGAPLRPAPAAARPFRWFAPALALLLCGYLFFSRSFAYLSIPETPLFVGELVLALGAFEAFRARRLIRRQLRPSAPLLAVGAFVLLCAIRLLVDLPRYGLDAVRDSAIWYYAAFAWLTAAAVASDPTFTPRLAGWFRRVLPWFLLWVPLAIVATRVPSISALTVPGSDTPVNSFKGGDLSVMAAVAIAFLWLELERAAGRRPGRRRDELVTVVGVLALLVLASQSRGGALAVATVLGTVLLCRPAAARKRLVGVAAAAVVLIVAPIVALDLRVDIGGRELSVRQVTTNAASLVDDEASEGTEAQTGLAGTLDWRRDYFMAIVDDSLSADHVLDGQGFGPVLSHQYIRDQPQAEGAQPLRNAHNSHITILARTGVPGMVLWVLLLVIWVAHVGRVALVGARSDWHPDVAMCTWAVGGVLGFCVLATTDPTLEGPQGGIWFWALIGFGAAHAQAWCRSPSRPDAARGAEATGRGAASATASAAATTTAAAATAPAPVPAPAGRG